MVESFVSELRFSCRKLGLNYPQSRQSGARIRGVLYVHDISVKRSNGKAPHSRLWDRAAMPKTALVTTNWSSDTEAILVKREQEMKEIHWKAFIDEGLCIFHFHQTSSDAWDIINHLLDHMSNVDVPVAMTIADESKWLYSIYQENPDP